MSAALENKIAIENESACYRTRLVKLKVDPSVGYRSAYSVGKSGNRGRLAADPWTLWRLSSYLRGRVTEGTR
jgi:hypothetical protein